MIRLNIEEYVTCLIGIGLHKTFFIFGKRCGTKGWRGVPSPYKWLSRRYRARQILSTGFRPLAFKTSRSKSFAFLPLGLFALSYVEINTFEHLSQNNYRYGRPISSTNYKQGTFFNCPNKPVLPKSAKITFCKYNPSIGIQNSLKIQLDSRKSFLLRPLQPSKYVFRKLKLMFQAVISDRFLSVKLA